MVQTKGINSRLLITAAVLFFIIFLSFQGFKLFYFVQEKESNNSATQAVKISAGSKMRGSIDSYWDHDWIVITTPRSRLSKKLLVKGLVASENVTFELYDSQLRFIAEVHEYDLGKRNVLFSFHVQDEKYFLRVRLKSAMSYPIPYTIYTRLKKISSGEEREPNDSISDAEHYTALTSRKDVRGNLFPLGDVDFFKVMISEAMKLSVAVSVEDGIDPAFEIFDSDFSSVLTVDTTKASQTEILPSLRVQQGTYYIKVFSKNKIMNTRSYTLSLTPQTKDSMESEPNDIFSQAETISLDLAGRKAHYYGHFNHAHDVDMYSFEVPEGQVLIELSPLALIDSEITVFDADEEKIFTIDSQGIGKGEISSVPLRRDGVYYVRVRQKSTVPLLDKMYKLSFTYLQSKVEILEQSENYFLDTNQVGRITLGESVYSIDYVYPRHAHELFDVVYKMPDESKIYSPAVKVFSQKKKDLLFVAEYDSQGTFWKMMTSHSSFVFEGGVHAGMTIEEIQVAFKKERYRLVKDRGLVYARFPSKKNILFLIDAKKLPEGYRDMPAWKINIEKDTPIVALVIVRDDYQRVSLHKEPQNSVIK
ncbi:PPC domain-containing protein [Candidatus Margulisiibacteriota bacterium]